MTHQTKAPPPSSSRWFPRSAARSVPTRNRLAAERGNHPDERGGVLLGESNATSLEGDILAARVFEAECDAYPEAIRLFAEGRLLIKEGRLRID